MLPNHSPWIKQLNRTRPITPLDEDLVADTLIVGGGIAGIMTAYFTLRDTERAVLLLEGDKVAHGATGHNAGQLVTYFERPFKSMVEEFGIEKASEGVRMVESAWELLEQIVREAKLAIPIHRFTGYAGVCLMEQLLEHLEDNLLQLQGGLHAEQIIVSETWSGLSDVPSKFEGLFERAAPEDVRTLLETNSQEYIAAVATPKGCSNSALLCEEIAGYLLSTYPTRFRLHEETRVETIRLSEGAATVVALNNTITARHVVLATNGFENFSIVNEHGPDIDTEFHHLVSGLIGYMAGYLEKSAETPTAISYYPKSPIRTDDDMGDDYFYLTRRPFDHEGSNAWSLTCVGGPDKDLPESVKYSRIETCDEDVQERITTFLAQDYKPYTEDGKEYDFCWHGLMGYTPNRVRRIGAEPCNPTLLYNLGCNGVGLLPSIMGGERIARILNGEQLTNSIFDPLHSKIGSV